LCVGGYVTSEVLAYNYEIIILFVGFLCRVCYSCISKSVLDAIEYVKLDIVLSLQKELVFVLDLFYNFGFKKPYYLGLYMISMSFLKGLWILIVGTTQMCM
jgi:hypothetical protein